MTTPCACRGAECQNRLDRRDFLKLAAAGTAGAVAAPWHAVAGPFTRHDFDKLVPADKRLSPEWLQSLVARGTPTAYRAAELEKIGMPIGGLCAGQLYLGGGGELWHWDLFNRHVGTGAEHYAKPLLPASPLEQGFALRIMADHDAQTRRLDRSHWRDVSFVGQYPMGFVEYRDPDVPVTVSLEAFSPFVPLNTDDSSLPATVLQFTIKNASRQRLTVELAGWLENAVGLHTGQPGRGLRRNRLVEGHNLLWLECDALPAPAAPSALRRPDIHFEDFERETYQGWTATGTAFGNGPVARSQIPAYQGDVGGQGQRVVNSHASAPGGNVEQKDSAVGRLTSRPFTLERDYINFLIGGGAHQGKTCLNLLVAGRQVASVTGKNDNRMQPRSLDTRSWAGQSAQLEIVDDFAGGWGNVGVDHIVFSDRPAEGPYVLEEQADFGTLGLALFGAAVADRGHVELPEGQAPQDVFLQDGQRAGASAQRPFGAKLVGALRRKLELRPGQSATVAFALVWHFPNLKMNRLPGGRHYTRRFASAHEVAGYLATELERLSAQTRLWHRTWYEGTLPHWFLERTFLNTSILATATCHRFGNGRFYAWEGVGCCEGTCGHVWQYAHALARLFPDLERRTREDVDFGLAQQPDGAIHFRGEFNDFPAIDAQAGTILRALREHQMSAEDAFLRRNWPAIRRALEWLIGKDADGDGIIEGNQHNTLDTDWFGPVAWLSGLYLAALRAGEQMALEAGDAAFARKARGLFERGAQRLLEVCWNGEYFINRPDPKRADTINSGSGCHIDQVFGQSWAFQVGLGRILPESQARAALQALWRYNFTPDVGPYRAAYKPGRWYAMPGEGGLLMCTFPRSDWDYDQAKGKGPDWAAGYFNECMNGFEYQVAGHMIWEGLVTEGLAITRMVHDRYHAARRNPWNEVECGDHYARSMASYGVFLAACGFEYHGPQGRLAFAPRLTPENFRAAFTTAEGWGSFVQQRQKGQQRETLEVRWGRLRLETLVFELERAGGASAVRVRASGRPIPAALRLQGKQATVTLAAPVEIRAGNALDVTFV